MRFIHPPQPRYLPYHRLSRAGARLLLVYLAIGARNGRYSHTLSCELAGLHSLKQHDRARQELIDLGFLIVRPTLLGHDKCALVLDTPRSRLSYKATI